LPKNGELLPKGGSCSPKTGEFSPKRWHCYLNKGSHSQKVGVVYKKWEVLPREVELSPKGDVFEVLCGVSCETGGVWTPRFWGLHQHWGGPEGLAAGLALG